MIPLDHKARWDYKVYIWVRTGFGQQLAGGALLNFSRVLERPSTRSPEHLTHLSVVKEKRYGFRFTLQRVVEEIAISNRRFLLIQSAATKTVHLLSRTYWHTITAEFGTGLGRTRATP